MIDRAQAGDRDALNELVSNYWQDIYRFAVHKTGCPEDAQEIAQETFIRTFRSLSRYRKTGAAFRAYLNRIALNLITDYWRKKGRNPELVDLAEYHQPIVEADQPDDLVISRETRADIAAVIKELPDDQRRVVELRIVTGLSVKDTALALGKSEAAIKMLQQRALKNLRGLFLKKGIIENQDGR